VYMVPTELAIFLYRTIAYLTTGSILFYTGVRSLQFFIRYLVPVPGNVFILYFSRNLTLLSFVYRIQMYPSAYRRPFLFGSRAACCGPPHLSRYEQVPLIKGFESRDEYFF
jgi:hypothetical protein